MSPPLPSITGMFEVLDVQRQGASLYDHIMETRFYREPRQRSLSTGGKFERVVYESERGVFRYTTEIVPNSWSTYEEKLEMIVPEPAMLDRQFANPPTCQSIYTFKVGGLGKMRMRLDVRQGIYYLPLVREFSLDRCREHEWNFCWTAEDPDNFFERGDYDEIWKAMMLLKISVDRTDPQLRMRNRWVNRRTTSSTLFSREIENAGGTKPYVQ